MNPPISTVDAALPLALPLRELVDLPGPPGLPRVGNLLQIKLARIHRDVEQWSARYGPLFRMQIGSRTVLVVADHEVTNAVLRARPHDFRRPSRTTTIGREMGLKPGVFNAEGAAWQNQRRMVMACFSPGNIRAYFPAMRKVTERLQGRWLAAARAGSAVDLQADLMRYTVDTLTGLAFGADINTLEANDDVIQRHLNRIFPALFQRSFSYVPYWRWFRLPADRQLERSVTAVNAAIDDFIAQARQRMRDEPGRREHPANLLEAMIAAADQPASGVSDADVAGNVLTLLLAGEDTTANTLAWMIYLLQCNPEALRRAQDEVRRLASDLSRFSRDNIGALDYLEACAHETMRLKPVAPFLPAEALRDTVVADVRVPAGTLVWNVLRHDSVSGRYFDDPEAFRPERWLGAAGAAPASGPAGSAKRVAMPFGAGPRVCPGRYLALLEIKMAMAMLLASFDIDSVTTPDGREAQELMTFTMGPVDLRMRLRLRART